MKPRAYLRKLRVTRVDLVPAGANPESHVVLAKANPFAGKPSGPAAGPTLGKVKMFLSMKNLDASPADVLAELVKPGTSKDPKIKAAAAAFSQSRSPVTATKETTMSDTDTAPLADLSAEDIDAIGTYVTDLAGELEAERARAAAALEALAKATEDDTDDEDVLKGLPDAVVERITKAEAAAAEATAKADSIMKAERERVFKARAAALVHLSGGDGDGADRLGSVLEKAEAALDADVYAELERTLTAADTQLTKAADITGTLGSDGDGATGEFIDTIKARSEALVAEGMDPVEAMRKARLENPDLAAEYLNARRGN